MSSGTGGLPSGRARGSQSLHSWLAFPGFVIGSFLLLGSLEFVGPNEEDGWTLAGSVVPVAYTAWSVWLIAAGVVLLIG